MAESTPLDISYPTGSDLIKTSADSAKLATDLKTMALSIDAAIASASYLSTVALSSGTDLWSLPPGRMYTVSNVVIARDLGLPRERPGWIIPMQIGNGKVLVYRSSEEGSQNSLEFTKQRTIGGVIQEWVSTAPTGETASESAGPVRRAMLQQKLTARKGGRIGTNGKGVVALRFDDAPADFVSKVLPLLRARNLPFTRVSTSDSVASQGITITDAILTEMQAYCIQDGGEVWNHGRDHADASGETAIYDNLIGALDKLRLKMPRIPIDCFAPPGGSAMSYDGHMPSTSVSNWADTYAGRLIQGYHALASGYMADTYYKPLDGILRDGQIQYSVDAYGVSNSSALVDRARDWGMGVVMMWHSNNLGTTGNMSMVDFEAVLDYIVAQRDAGNILVLTKSGMGVADASSVYRDNLLVGSSGATFSEAVLYPQFRQNITGSTRELTATVTGTAGATVTSVVGESTKTHTIPAGGTLQLRHVATIPLDATSLTVSINANTTNARLLAV